MSSRNYEQLAIRAVRAAMDQSAIALDHIERAFEDGADEMQRRGRIEVASSAVTSLIKVGAEALYYMTHAMTRGAK